MNKNEFKIWLDTAKPGAVFVYHRGESGSRNNAFMAAWEAMEQGLVLLSQKRDPQNPHILMYQATKKKRVGGSSYVYA